MATEKLDSNSAAGVLGRVAFLRGQNEMPKLAVTTPWSEAEIYLHGAHVTRFRKKDEAPLLFLSKASRFEAGRAIRGGVPIIFPWFGPRPGMAQHGFARVKEWELKEVAYEQDGGVSVLFHLPAGAEAAAYPAYRVEYRVTVRESLTLALSVTNRSEKQEFAFENCLHTYFEVGDVTAISVTGLKGVGYLDQVGGAAQRVEANEAIRFSSEVDRVYVNTADTVEILDPRLGRKVRIEKAGSASTVVWNPWVAKAQQMADFGDEEYERMVCVESGNVGPNGLRLAPGQRAELRVRLSSAPLG